jgi:type IV pilus assembly protein PilN
MIRINLLGVPKAKRGKRPAMGGMAPSGGGAPNLLIVLVVLAGLAAAGNWYYYRTLEKDAADLKVKIEEANRENLRLAEVKAKYLELEKQKDIYERRVNVIHQLQDNRSGPARLLTMVSDTVNKTDAVWLRTVKEEGNSISMEGVALSVDAVASLMHNLKNSGYFKTVEIKDTFQDDVVKNMSAFVFILVCEKQPQQKS